MAGILQALVSSSLLNLVLALPTANAFHIRAVQNQGWCIGLRSEADPGFMLRGLPLK